MPRSSSSILFIWSSSIRSVFCICSVGVACVTVENVGVAYSNNVGVACVVGEDVGLAYSGAEVRSGQLYHRVAG